MNNHHRLPTPEKNMLALFSDIAKEWDYERNGDLKPEQYAPNYGESVLWKCKNCGERWRTTIDNRTKGYGCPLDSRRSSSGFEE